MLQTLSPIRLGLTLILALAALVLTCVFDARPDSGRLIGPRAETQGAGRWCGPAATRGGRSCGYSTFDQCLAAASSDYRTCRPNPAALIVPDDATYWTYRSVFL